MTEALPTPTRIVGGGGEIELATGQNAVLFSLAPFYDPTGTHMRLEI